MTADWDRATRDRLAEALRANLTEALDGYGWSWAASDLDDIAEELTAELLAPRGVVAELVREGQAEALEAAARDVVQDDQGTDDWYATWLRARAAALRAGDPA